MTTSQELGRECGSWTAQAIWIIGTFGALIAGYTSDPLWGFAILGVTLALTLACAWWAARWGAFPAVFGALALQALACASMGAASLDGMLGNHWYWWSMTNALDGGLFLQDVAPAFLPATLLGIMLRSKRLMALGRRVAIRALPFALAAAAVLVGLATYRAARLPTAEHYADDLPVVATVAGVGDACRDGRVLESGERYCETAPQVIAGRTLFYGCKIDARDSRWCHLQERDAEGIQQLPTFVSDTAADHDLVRDPRLGLLLREGVRLSRFAPPNTGPIGITLHDIRHHIAPPTGWLWIAAAGLGVVVALQLGRRWLTRALGVPTPAHGAWHARLRGDLAVVSLGTLFVTQALLVAALVRGFLV